MTMRRNVEDIYPLAPQQLGMLMGTLSTSRPGLYVEQMTCRIDGVLDNEAFADAWQRVVARHAVLRTAFVWKDQARPMQVVLRDVPLSITWNDLRAHGATERERRVGAYLAEDRLRGFDLAHAPLMRLAVMRTSDREQTFVFTIHHILMDGWCQPILFREALAFYQSARTGRPADFPPARPYRQYIEWLKNNDAKKAEAFWRERLRGVRSPTPPGIRQKGELLVPAEDSAESVEFALSPSATKRLTSMARERRITPSTVLHGLWAVLLSAYSGEHDVLFGATVSGRPPDLPGIESMIGLFINTMPVRAHVPDTAPFWDWLRGLQEDTAKGMSFGHFSAGQMQEWSDIEGGKPFYESILVLENYPTDALSADGGAIDLRIDRASVKVRGAQTQYALAVLASVRAEISFRLVPDRRRLREADVRSIGRHWLALLERVAAEPAVAIGELRGSVPATEVPSLVDAREATSDPGARPRTAVEQALSEIWTSVLGDRSVGIRDNFFRLGGHSLSAVELLTRVRETFHVDLPLRALFEQPTIEALAQVIARARGKDAEYATVLASLPRITPSPGERLEPFPLTDVQEAYWIGRHQGLDFGNVSTHGYTEVSMTGIDLDRLVRAWRRLIDRHDMLRAVVGADGRQRILPQVPPYEIEVLDLRGCDRARIDAEIDAIRQHLRQQVLPADRWPLFEIRATLLDEGRTLLHVSADALIFDAWSSRILMAELRELYRNEDTRLAPLELTFRDYVLAEASLRETEIFTRSREYWLKRLPELPAAPDLPVLHNREAVANPRFERRSGALSRETWSRLKERAVRAGLTPTAVVLAAFAEVLAAWSKSPVFTLNLTLFNRLPMHPQVDQIVGDFTSLLLLAIDGASAGTFTERAQRVQRQLWDDFDHRHFSGVRVLRELARKRGGAHGALMPIVFTSTLTQKSLDDDRGQWLGEIVDGVSQTPQVSLDHQVFDDGRGGLGFNWDSVEDLFAPGVIDHMFAAESDLLHLLAQDEAAWTAPIRSLTPESQLAVRAHVNDTAGQVGDKRLHEPFIDQAKRDPTATAIISAARTLSYGETHRQALALAARIREAGAGPGDLVPILMDKGWQQIVGALAVLYTGAAYVPIDARLPGERIRELLQSSEARVVLTVPAICGDDWPKIRRIDVAWSDAPVDEEAAVARGNPDDLAYVIYTSGSTGVPKGVMIGHRGALNTILDINERFSVGPRDRVLGLSSLSFDLSVYDIFGMLAAGGAVVLPASSALRDPAEWAQAMESHRVTMWNSVPALMQALVEYHESQGRRLARSLRVALLSGDWIGVGLPDRVRRLADNVRLISLGGATEASIWSIIYPIERVASDWTSIPYGRPLKNQTFHVLDAALAPRPDWVPGELYIGGLGLAHGYWRDEDKTNLRFVVHPQTGERLYRTGDWGRYWPDGNIEFLGRDDLQVKINGHRIELGEIEACLASDPRIAAAAVSVSDDRGSKRLVAYVVLRHPGTLGSAEVRKLVARRLPEPMVPGSVVFLPALPRTATGKLDRAALAPPATGTESSGDTSETAPAPFAAEIARTIETTLGIAQVGVDANLLELGATSVDMIRIANALQKELNFRPPIDAFFRAPTVRALADLRQQTVVGTSHAPEVLLEPSEREQFKRLHRAAPAARHGDLTVVLPETTPRDDGIDALLRLRRSHRRFLNRPVAFESLARLFGLLREEARTGERHHHYPSAGGIYPVRTYLHVRRERVIGVPAGIYVHDPFENRLIARSEGDIPPEVHERFINRPVFEQAAFSIFFIARMGAIRPLYGAMARDYCLIEAGAMLQLLMMAAPGCDLGLCPVGGLDFERIRSLFALEPDDELVHSALGGVPSPAEGPGHPTEGGGNARVDFEI